LKNRFQHELAIRLIPKKLPNHNNGGGETSFGSELLKYQAGKCSPGDSKQEKWPSIQMSGMYLREGGKFWTRETHAVRLDRVACEELQKMEL
jgi:hypothetical protein